MIAASPGGLKSRTKVLPRAAAEPGVFQHGVSKRWLLAQALDHRWKTPGSAAARGRTFVLDFNPPGEAAIMNRQRRDLHGIDIGIWPDVDFNALSDAQRIIF